MTSFSNWRTLRNTFTSKRLKFRIIAAWHVWKARPIVVQNIAHKNSTVVTCNPTKNRLQTRNQNCALGERNVHWRMMWYDGSSFSKRNGNVAIVSGMVIEPGISAWRNTPTRSYRGDRSPAKILLLFYYQNYIIYLILCIFSPGYLCMYICTN